MVQLPKRLLNSPSTRLQAEYISDHPDRADAQAKAEEPRVPRGQPGGGQWTRGGNLATALSDEPGSAANVYKAENARGLIGSSYGSGECVDFVKKAVPDLKGSTLLWKPGISVMDNIDRIPLGTAIATFEKDGTYANKSGKSHAAIYDGPYYDPKTGKLAGLYILDQWNESDGHRKVKQRTISLNSTSLVNNARSYSTINRR